MWLLRSAENQTDTFDQFVRPNGELYRTEAFHNKMKKTASGFLTYGKANNDEILNSGEATDDEQLLTNCFTIQSVAAHLQERKTHGNQHKLNSCQTFRLVV